MIWRSAHDRSDFQGVEVKAMSLNSWEKLCIGNSLHRAATWSWSLSVKIRRSSQADTGEDRSEIQVRRLLNAHSFWAFLISTKRVANLNSTHRAIVKMKCNLRNLYDTIT